MRFAIMVAMVKRCSWDGVGGLGLSLGDKPLSLGRPYGETDGWTANSGDGPERRA